MFFKVFLAMYFQIITSLTNSMSLKKSEFFIVIFMIVLSLLTSASIPSSLILQSYLILTLSINH